jgi:predicted Rossmann fold nucleotide-binding protein DprA/Smf involved in DNA uptake
MSAVPQRPSEPIAKPVELPPDLNETERKIIEAIGNEPMPIDAVVLAVELPVHIVRATIAVLQMKKLVCQVEGNQVRRS